MEQLTADTLELTIYWNDNSIGIYNGQIGPQGLITGTTFDKNHPQTTAQFHSAAVVSCAAIAVTDTRPTWHWVGLGLGAHRFRFVIKQNLLVRATRPMLLVLRRFARRREGLLLRWLRRRWHWAGSDHGARNLLQPLLQITYHVESYGPVRAPHDLINGPITYYGQDGEQIYQIVIGVPIAVACTYNLDLVPGPISFGVQPWNGRIQIGGQVPQNLKFQGDPQGGQHQGRVFWTPQATGRTPITCALNQGFERFEANPGNNFHTDRIEVVAAPAP